MSKCDTCKFHTAEDGWAACDRCIHCPGMTDMYKPLTNADHIRAMTDEELAAWLYELDGRDLQTVMPFCPCTCGEVGLETEDITVEMCIACLARKLQQPYESPTGQKG